MPTKLHMNSPQPDPYEEKIENPEHRRFTKNDNNKWMWISGAIVVSIAIIGLVATVIKLVSFERQKKKEFSLFSLF